MTGNRLLFVLLCLGLLLGVGPADAAEKWQGVDEAVVGKIAREHGREARPFIAFEGDVQLMSFLLAGAAGGFVAGYYWRKLLEGRKEQDEVNRSR